MACAVLVSLLAHVANGRFLGLHHRNIAHAESGFVGDVGMRNKSVFVGDAGHARNATALSAGMRPFTVCAMGDSITAGIIGYNSTTYARSQGFRGELASRLAAKGAELIGYEQAPCPAIQGATTYILARQLEATNYECGSDRGPLHPDMVLMLVGINDLMQGLAPGGAVHQVKLMLEGLWKVAPRTQVLLASIFGRGTTAGTYVSYYNQGLMDLVFSLKNRNHPVEFVPMQARTKMCLPETCDLDMIHPNLEGYAKIADVWWEFIEPHLSTRKA